MLIRKFAKNDLDQVLELCREVRQIHIDIINDYFAEQNDELEKMVFLQSLENDQIIALVAVEDNIIYGYLLAKKKYLPYLREANVISIENLGVKKEFRGQGIGKKLMDILFKISESLNADEIRLGVYDKNEEAYRFYKKYGFELLEKRMHIRLKND